VEVGDLVIRKTIDPSIVTFKQKDLRIGIVIKLEYNLRHQVGGFPRSVFDVVVLWPSIGVQQEMHERLVVVASTSKETRSAIG